MAQHPWGDPQGADDTAYDAFGRPYSKRGYEAYANRARTAAPGAAPAPASAPAARAAGDMDTAPRTNRATLVAILVVVALIAVYLLFRRS